MELNYTQYRNAVNYVKSKISNNGNFEINNELESQSKELKAYILSKIQKNQFTMFYQPIYNNENKIKCAEALFRMKNSSKIISENDKAQFVDPEVIFYFLKEENLEKGLVLQQIEKICSDIKEFKILDEEHNGNPNHYISINIPLKAMDENFVRVFLSTLKKHNISGSNIQIEILENENFGNMNNYFQIMNVLKSYGVKFALDDYGSGNTNKNVLNLFDFDCIKIDKMYLNQANREHNYGCVSKKFIEIKTAIPSANIIMEGVDSDLKNQVNLETVVKNLSSIGKMNYQGFGFSKPVPITAFAQKSS